MKTTKNSPINPYITGKQEWFDRYGNYVKQARIWQTVGIICLILTVISVAGAISLATRSQYIPYVIELDKTGKVVQASYPKTGMDMKASYIKAHLTDWVENTRSVWTDGAAQRLSVEKSFASLSRTDQSFTFVSNFSRENWKRGHNENVSVEVIGKPLPITEKSWQIEWREIIRSVQGVLIREERWKATLEVYITKNPNPETILRNPLGIYIKSVDWTKQNTKNY